ncbi:hypothetical protein GCM10010922_09480 [Microbacterium sorbitolivorans]|uniref:VOC family protein n=1 Tax=Microbacterium sorbitolivorans TaxID=1867410 RepID=A0A367XXW5_9MICO|nr:hypothetical protein [Microbacterium sorbitolivorans]RCK58424.1 hypothetical protein DTO57_09655 [Microbacterium sorbitolivorans]GGF36409.1 hypothetical protein GCM10010922_09480 [Microbacterium sorbitolivorans]
MTAVQQIVYARDTAAWHRMAEAMGLVAPYPATPEWAEFHGQGSLAIHHATDAHPAGSVDLHLLVDSLDDAESALADWGVTRELMEGVGDLLKVPGITIAEGSVPAREGALAMQPIWFAPDIDRPRRILEALGLRASIAADRGGWVDFASNSGSVGLHHADAESVGPSFVALELEHLAASLRDAGFDAAIIDEAYGRTVRFPDPDGIGEVWINEPQLDMHGYHRED